MYKISLFNNIRYSFPTKFEMCKNRGKILHGEHYSHTWGEHSALLEVISSTIPKHTDCLENVVKDTKKMR